ncbi:DNA polymerase III subunit delta [bacterium]|nr:DNA polymerase III subunit delta [bacterium]
MAVRRSKTEEGISPENFVSRLDSLDFGNFYVLLGEDYTRAEQFLETLRARLVPAGTEDFALEVITVDKDHNGAGEIIGAAETLPFMGGFRLVIVRHGEELDAAALESLGEYAAETFEHKREGMLLVICMTSLDKRLKFTKTLMKMNAIIDCEPEPIRDLREFADKYYGKDLTPAGERAFSEIVGSDRRRVVAEMEKVSLYTGDRKEITEADVMAICADSNIQDEWELRNCLLAGDVEGAFSALRNMRLDPQGTEEGIFAKLCYIISDLPQAAQAAGRGDMRGARVFPGNPRYGEIRHFLGNLSIEKQRLVYSLLMYQMIAFRGSALPKEAMDDLLCLSLLGEDA